MTEDHLKLKLGVGLSKNSPIQLQRRCLVVRRPVNANPVLTFNLGSRFSYSKKFAWQIPSGRLKATEVKT